MYFDAATVKGGRLNSFLIVIAPNRNLLIYLLPRAYSATGGKEQLFKGSEAQISPDGLKEFALGYGGTAINMEMNRNCNWADVKGQTCELTFTLVDSKKEN